MVKIPCVVPKTGVVGPKLLLRDGEVASRLGCSRRHVWELLTRGELCPPCRLGRLVRWRAVDIEAWVEGLPHVHEVELIAPRRGRPRRVP